MPRYTEPLGATSDAGRVHSTSWSFATAPCVPDRTPPTFAGTDIDRSASVNGWTLQTWPLLSLLVSEAFVATRRSAALWIILPASAPSRSNRTYACQGSPVVASFMSMTSWSGPFTDLHVAG